MILKLKLKRYEYMLHIINKYIIVIEAQNILFSYVI